MEGLVTHRFVVEEEFAKVRADKFLALKLPDISRSKIKFLIDNNCALLNNQPFANCSYKVLANDEFTLKIEEKRGISIPARAISFDIVYEDEYLLVINKPAGLTVHPGAGNHDNTLVNALLEYCGDTLSSISGEARPGIVHRLDKDTSGLMMVAKNDIIHTKLAEQLASRQIKRVYHALVYGVPCPIAGKIIANIGRSKKNHKLMAVMRTGGKNAITHYRILNNFSDTVCLLECTLETGRTHQIRVHLLSKRNPIIGDRTYAKGYNFNLSALPHEAQEALNGLKRQALHATSITFVHPVTCEEMKFECNYPNDINNVLKTLFI
jgi:23S rRNA pseudouridine1911/1915/1917 synthase